MIADTQSYLAEITAMLRTEWPANRTVNIVCHGHSVPAGYFKTPHVDTLNAYPHLLHAWLKQRFPHAVINVIVTAIGGENSESGAKRIPDVLAHRPDIVTFDYALNDRRIGLMSARVAWRSMIERAKTYGAKVLVLTPTGDLSSKLDDPADPLNQHAEQVRILASEHSVALVDSLAATKSYLAAGHTLDELMSQVNHPNRAGHEIVAGELLAWFP